MSALEEVRDGGLVVPTYWWDGHPNFGDDLTPWLLPRLGIAPIHREPAEAKLIGVGSILEFLPTNWDGAVWGSGLMNDQPFPLSRATPLAVRGRLTAERIGAQDSCALGDPGILVSRFLPRSRPRWDVALVPHGHHRNHSDFLQLASSRHVSVRVVNVHQGAARAVKEIASACVVVTTSLHGLVTADSYGIPVVWTTLEPSLGGGDFKFRDYESAITPGDSRYVRYTVGMTLTDLTSAARSAPADAVAARADALVHALDRLPHLVRDRRFPRGVIDVLRGASPSSQEGR